MATRIAQLLWPENKCLTSNKWLSNRSAEERKPPQGYFHNIKSEQESELEQDYYLLSLSWYYWGVYRHRQQKCLRKHNAWWLFLAGQTATEGCGGGVFSLSAKIGHFSCSFKGFSLSVSTVTIINQSYRGCVCCQPELHFTRVLWVSVREVRGASWNVQLLLLLNVKLTKTATSSCFSCWFGTFNGFNLWIEAARVSSHDLSVDGHVMRTCEGKLVTAVRMW